MFSLIARFTFTSEAAVRGFDALAVELASEVRRSEPRTLTYLVHAVADDPLVRVFYEVYQDREAFEAHQKTPHTQRFFAAYEQFTNDLQVDVLTPLEA
ncbi:putative quinol monooxygenase [Streptomyces sp. NBC_01264]|uniref:putative quinol monooxygenase n=1 Tax=Streptomyces sp. NBC_01264 TaxID=2903804 RepID=UPI0022515FB7|nr:antibiotic biosynthesis monooxygenase [Streptomyces sp. NBC_01264]MCX4781722.1 antibiotic biosynthesis monooxygenase [Streptomyces sp. NBC_01264]